MKNICYTLIIAVSAPLLQIAHGADEKPEKPKSINGLLLWYPFCGNANDASGNGRHGTVNGAELTADRFGTPNHAYRIEEGGNGIDSPFQFKDPTAERTFSIWFMTESWGSDRPGYYQGHAGKGKVDLIYGVNAALSIWDNGTAGLDGPYHNAVFTGEPLEANKWHHVCLSYSGRMDAISVWVNGKLLNQQKDGFLNNPGSKPIKNTPSDVKIPGESGTSYDELRAYDTAFTETDAIRLFNEQRPSGTAGCGSSKGPGTGGRLGSEGEAFRIPGVTPGIAAPPAYWVTNLAPSQRALILPNDPRLRRYKVRSEGKGESKEPTEPIIPNDPAVAEQPVYPPGNLPEGRPIN